jgi:hypothetical protein
MGPQAGHVHFNFYSLNTLYLDDCEVNGGGGKSLFYCNDITFQTAKYEITIKNILEEQPKLFLN